MAARNSLPDEVKAFIVQALACYDEPSVVVRAVKDDFALVVSRQQVEAYDPTKRAGHALAKKWRDLRESTRKAFLEDTASIGISHRVVRLRRLDRMAGEAEKSRNFPLVAQLLEQAAKETGGAFGDKRRVELSGPDGGPVQGAVTGAVQVVIAPTPEGWHFDAAGKLVKTEEEQP